MECQDVSVCCEKFPFTDFKMEYDQGTKVKCTVLGAGQLELYHCQMQEYQQLLFEYSKRVLIITNDTLLPADNPIYQDRGGYQCGGIDPTEAKIYSLMLRQAEMAADIAKLNSERTTNADWVSRTTLPSTSSERASPRSADYPHPPGTSRPSDFPTHSPSPKLNKPPYVPSPVIESTPKATPRPTSSMLLPQLPPETAELPQTYNHDHNDTGTQCDSDVEFVSETERASDDSDYVEEVRNRSKHRKHIIRDPVQDASRLKPLHSNSAAAKVTNSKRSRYPADRFTPDNVKPIAEEGLYISSDKRVKEEGSLIQADRFAFYNLQYHFGKAWKREKGKGLCFGMEVVVNPNGTGYVLKNNPTLGKDYFLSAQDAFAYCTINCSPTVPLPVSADSIEEGQNIPVDNNVVEAENNEVNNDVGSVYSDDSGDVSSFEATYYSCSCRSSTNCRCNVLE